MKQAGARVDVDILPCGDLHVCACTCMYECSNLYKLCTLIFKTIITYITVHDVDRK